MNTHPSRPQAAVAEGSPDAFAGRCPGCGSETLSVFYEMYNAPVHSVLLMRTREEALAFPTGDVVLAHCATCGFITNVAFDPGKQNYSAEYEETQGFSGTFSAFHRRLAEDLIARYGLRGKTVIEIGCGKGEFLTLLCRRGPNEGVGFDPAYVPERNTDAAQDRITFIEDFYSEKYAHYTGDFVCCKMTLEHIPDTARFIGMLRRSIGDQRDTVVFFQVPEVRRVLRDLAFWDIYYEHCSYFSQGSLAGLFRRQGFDVLNTWTDYDDQYLMIEARPRAERAATQPEEGYHSGVGADVSRFARRIQPRLAAWRRLLQEMKGDGRRVVLWGGGSKAVAFLTTLGVQDEVACAVDINPYKHGTFLAGTGHEIVAPDALRTLAPDVVLMMNPIYREEIQRDLHRMDLSPTLLDIDLDPAHANA